jgi:CheY-like chemotaxis protein
VAKILVADDNSNIQKMVGLALKDQGIDVVAVGNGEAAVRKISDIIPDLVLADVFMPVRNGYEVCQYVKQDPALAHIPVILLVGAFDPLDEQEAQRVGADGVLKKPFVPPDPLIAMVKAALTRAGVSYSSEKTLSDGAGKNGDKKGSDLLKPRPLPAAAPIVIPTPPPVVTPDSISMEDVDLVEEVSLVSTTPPPVNMDGGVPLAFANLMDSTAAVEEDPGFMPTVHPELALERDWRAAEEPDDVPEEEEEEQPKASWRRDSDEAGAADGSSKVSSWRETAFEAPAAQKSAGEDWDIAAVPAATEAAATTPEITAAITHQPESGIHAVASETPFSADAWSSASSTVSSAGAQVLTAEAPAEVAAETVATVSNEAAGEVANEAAAQSANGIGAETEHSEAVTAQTFEHEAVATAIDRFAGSQDAAGELEQASPMATSAWEVQAQKASLLAATWDTPVAAAGETAPAEAELSLGETRDFSEKVEAAAPKELLAEPGEIVDGNVGEVAEVAAPVEFAAAEVATAEAPAAEQQEFAQAPAVEQEQVEEHAAVEQSSVEQPSIEQPSVEQHANEIDGGYGAGAVESAYEAADPGVEQAADHVATPEEIQAAESAYAAEPIVEQQAEPEHIAPEVVAEVGSDAQFEVPQKEVTPEVTPEVAAVEETVSAVEHVAALEEAAVIAAPAEAALESAVHVAADGASKSATDDVVARVLASLSPEVMQAVTRELLKPVVEAMVREELKKRE